MALSIMFDNKLFVILFEGIGIDTHCKLDFKKHNPIK